MSEIKYVETSGHALRAYELHYKFHSSLLTASIDAAKEAIKAALLLNGSACIALLSFLAVISGRESGRAGMALIQPTKEALAYFAFGALAAALGSGLAFVSYVLRANSEAHYDLMDKPPFTFPNNETKRFMFFSIIATVGAISAVVCSYGLFAFSLVSVSARF